VTFVVPEGVDDPARVSGGNVFDLRVREGLAALGWKVPLVTATGEAAASALRTVEDGGLVLIDGLVAAHASEAVAVEAKRLRIVVLAHMDSTAFPDADAGAVEGERRAFAAAARIVATSAWTARRLTESGTVGEDAVVVAPPGAEEASAAEGTPEGTSFLCIGVVAPHKGQDVLVDALAQLDAGAGWTCTIAGALDVDPAFALAVQRRIDAAGIAGQVLLAGVLSGPSLDDAYHRADLVVAPSRVESYGMVVADALRRGIPVVASDVGGIPEATRTTSAATLVPPGDPAALADVLRSWMTDPDLRSRLTATARRDRLRVPGWNETAAHVAAALEEAR
jgi:glycosyltransferase involved in cell wall biosynthesis